MTATLPFPSSYQEELARANRRRLLKVAGVGLVMVGIVAVIVATVVDGWYQTTRFVSGPSGECLFVVEYIDYEPRERSCDDFVGASLVPEPIDSTKSFQDIFPEK